MTVEPPAHLADKYRLYAIWLDRDFMSRPNQSMLIIHIGRPVSFETLCDTYIFQHMELTVEKSGDKIPVKGICGIQKIDNQNKPNYELTMDGTLKEL